MHVRASEDNFGPEHTLRNLRSLVVYDDADQPLLLVQRFDTGAVIVTTAADPAFRDIAKSFGLDLMASYKTSGKKP